jgi:hypothetical protein
LESYHVFYFRGIYNGLPFLFGQPHFFTGLYFISIDTGVILNNANIENEVQNMLKTMEIINKKIIEPFPKLS